MARHILVLFLALCCVNGLYGQTEGKKVAVYVAGGVDAAYKTVVGSKIVSKITESGVYTAVERTADFLKIISKESDYQYSGAVSDSQIMQIGQQFGVQYVAAANVEELFGSVFISARMINVETGQICSATESGKKIDNIDTLIAFSESVAQNLIDGIETAYLARYNLADVKVKGPYSKISDAYDGVVTVPEGYHVASVNEILALINAYKQIGKRILFPIGVDLEVSNERWDDGIFIGYRIVVSGVRIDTDSGETYGFHSEAAKISTFYVDIPVKDRRLLDPDSDGFIGNGSNRIEHPFYIYLLKD